MTALRTIGKLSISVLVFYYFWYNEIYGHHQILVYGAFVLMAACLLPDILLSGKQIATENTYYGFFVNVIMTIYTLFPGILIAYDIPMLMENVKLLGQYSVIMFAINYYSVVCGGGSRWLCRAIAFSAMLCCCSLLAHPYEYLGQRFTMSRTNNPNALGVALFLGIFAILYMSRMKLTRGIPSGGFAGLLLYGIVRTASRKCLIAALILVLLWLVSILQNLKSKLNGSAWLVMFTLIGAGLLYGAGITWGMLQETEMGARFGTMFSEESNGHRMLFYEKAMEIFLSKPLFGGGLEQFRFWSGTGAYAHSTYAEALADFGFVGCSIYFLPILGSGFGIMRLLTKNRSDNPDRMAAALWCAEMFLGIGQIFFLDFYHYLAWTMIYMHLSGKETGRHELASPKCRYFRMKEETRRDGRYIEDSGIYSQSAEGGQAVG